jgi:hypothetical protein
MQALNKTGIALRSTVFSPSEIVRVAKTIDQSGISHVFLPDIWMGYDSLELSAASLGVSKGLKIGPGIIRLHEQDPYQFLRKLKTLQALSENRFLLGIGTGEPGPDPKKKVMDMVENLRELKNQFSSTNGITFPEVYIATLKQGIAKTVAPDASGLLLNFCSASYASSLVQAVKASFSGNLHFACYLKVFFSRSQKAAERMMIQEFANYDSMLQYHKMFERDGVAADIAQSKVSLKNEQYAPTQSLLEISPVNPTKEELINYVSRYRKAGVTIPCIYPYFSPDEDYDYKLATVRMILSAVAE